MELALADVCGALLLADIERKRPLLEQQGLKFKLPGARCELIHYRG